MRHRRGITIDVLDQLARVIEQNGDDLLARWRAQVRELPSARDLDTPTLNDHVPHLLVELAKTFRSGTEKTIAKVVTEGTPPAHGLQRFKDAFDIEEVVAEYNILRGCIHDLADRNELSIQGEPFRVLNKVLDGAIGAAVSSFAAAKALEVRRRREEYLAFVAHDLRTPLNAISLTARVVELLLVRNGNATAETTQTFKTLNRNVRHLQDLIGKVLDESVNLETEVGIKLVPRQFDLWPLVEALVHDLHPVAGTDSTRLTNSVPQEFVVYADASLLRRVFQNLIANAISYTPRGEVVIGATVLDADGSVECFVRDNGDGIPEDRLSSVFDKHETDAEKPGGLGLGLAIVKTFVEAHKGVVSVESTRGVGSTFRFTLPGQQK